MYPIVQILRHPHTLLRVYRSFIDRGDGENSVADFFKHHTRANELKLVLQRRVELSESYTQYLEDHGLMTTDEEAERKEAEIMAAMKDGIAKAKAIRQSPDNFLVE